MPDSIPNSTSTTSVLTVNGATVDSNIDYVGDQDWWRIDLIANTRYQFSLNPFGVDGSGDAYLRLLNASGNQIAYDDDTGGGGSPRSDSVLIFTPTATGNYVYLLRVLIPRSMSMLVHIRLEQQQQQRRPQTKSTARALQMRATQLPARTP